jgi:hypothetical protein
MNTALYRYIMEMLAKEQIIGLMLFSPGSMVPFIWMKYRSLEILTRISLVSLAFLPILT